MFFNTCTLLLTVLLPNLHRNKSKLYKAYANIENGVSLQNIWGLFLRWRIRPKQRMKINFWPLRNVQQCKLLCLIALTPRNKTIFKRCIQYYPAILSHQWFYLHSLIHTYNLTFILHIYLLSIVTQWGFYAFMTICNNMVLWRAIENITVYHMIFWSSSST